MAAAKSRVCFVIAPIGDGALTWSDKVLSKVIEPAMKRLGFVVIRGDILTASGTIMDQITELLFRADLVIADVTRRNPNVFYEIGIRHVVGRPIVQIAKVREELAFDVAGLRTVYIDIDGGVLQAKRDVRSAAEGALGLPAMTSISQRYRVTIEPLAPPLFGEHLAEAVMQLIKHARGKRGIAPAPAARKWYRIDIPEDVVVSLDGISKPAIDMLFLLLEHLSEGSVAGLETSSASALTINTRPTIVDGVDVPSLSVSYEIQDDRIRILHVAVASK